MITRTGAQGKKKGEGNQRKSGAFSLSHYSTLSRRCNGRDANVIAFLRSLPSFLPGDEALSKPSQRVCSLKSRSVVGGGEAKCT